jgi:phospholipid/cholesterol/gamma-HCH transport system substrate-binding protein
MSKEARIGLLVAISILVFFAGFYFLKGSNLFSREYEYHAFYDNVQGLQPSAAVQIHGLQVGKVTDIILNRAQLGSPIEVVIAISKKTRLPRGTVAKLTSLDLLGSKGITLDLGTSSELVNDDEKLPSAVEGGLIDKISVEVSPLLVDVRKVVNNIDSVLTSVNQIFSPQARADLQQSIAALHVAMDNFSGVSSKLNRQGDALAHAIQNADQITTNLARNNENIDKTLSNLRTTTDNLSKAPINEAIRNVDEMAANLKDIVRKINANEGSLGLLVHDKDLYTNLNKTLEEFSKLSADLKAHPSRYINLTIFGRKAQAASQ